MTKIIVIALALNAGCGGSMSPRYPDVPVASLPKGAAPVPVPFPHFPDRVHAVVWRNWELIEPTRIARVIRATTSQVLELAESMGLPPRDSSRPRRVRASAQRPISASLHPAAPLRPDNPSTREAKGLLKF